MEAEKERQTEGEVATGGILCKDSQEQLSRLCHQAAGSSPHPTTSSLCGVLVRNNKRNGQSPSKGTQHPEEVRQGPPAPSLTPSPESSSTRHAAPSPTLRSGSVASAPGTAFLIIHLSGLKFKFENWCLSQVLQSFSSVFGTACIPASTFPTANGKKSQCKPSSSIQI